MLVLHFDYPSPAAVVALLRLQALADDGLPVAFNGVDVLGLASPIPVTLDQLEELEQWGGQAAELGLELRRPRHRPATLAAHLAGERAEVADVGAAWRWACLTAYWRDGADLGDPEVLVELARGIGLDADEVGALVRDRQELVAARRRMLELRGRGVGGVPVLEAHSTFLSADLPDEDLRELASV